MTLNKLHTSQISNTNATDGQVLQYVAANTRVEFVTFSSGSGNAHAVQGNAAAFASYANTTFATDTDLNTVSSNVDSAVHGITGANANITANKTISDTFGSYANTTFATDTDLNTVSSNAATNTTNINTVQGNAAAFASYANTTFSTGSGNTQVYVGSTLVANTAILLGAGDGINLAANTTSKTVTITTQMSNVTSQVIATDGTANSFGIAKAAANANMLLVSINGLLLNPTEYSVNSTTLTVSNTDPLIAGSNVEVRHFDFFSLGGVSSSSGGGGGGASPEPYQGEISGYSTGGNHQTLGAINNINKYSFTTDQNATDVGDRTETKYGVMGSSSSTHGYAAGGTNPGGTVDTIDKFPFSSDTNAADVGELAFPQYYGTGHTSPTHGYAVGHSTTMSKYPFSSDSSALDIGELTSTVNNRAGVSSDTNGYSAGVSVIDKFPFSSDTNSTNIGNLAAPTTRVQATAGQNSDTHGYASGGVTPPNVYNNYISKFPFASDTNGQSNVAGLTEGRSAAAGTSSTTSGYTSGGRDNPSAPIGYRATIDKFPFSSDSPASSVGNLAITNVYAASQQV